MRTAALLLACLGLGVACLAAQASFNVGSQAAAWLNLPDSARVAAMGGASVALADDVNCASVNPAGLGALGDQEVSLMHNAYVQDTALEHIAYGLGLPGGNGAALSVDYMNYGAIQAYSSANGVLTPDGSINPYGLGVGLGYGHSFGGLDLGLTVKLVDESLAGAGASSTVGGDVGVRWRQQPDSGFAVGLAAQNIGGQLDGADLPAQVQAGLAYRLPLMDGRQRLAVAADAVVPSADSQSSSVDLGAEYAGDSLWAIRLGYSVVGNNGVGGLDVGGGLTYAGLSFDYAFVAEGVLGNANFISLSGHFAGPSGPDAPTARPGADGIHF